ncbi:HAD-like protein [Lophiostoma macrostomum CBS 122681]|uniref:HAD-like protein n=1 Tax=Lophiostoma macrostomum CBS 122681 TaxID=1314788 RepID=A0A6A6SNZ2_9PLEO|nr:HAD-like protein [Lophiostoma macrostomum CBS 122681]
MKAYNTLSVFPDVPPLFEHLRQEDNAHIHAAIFSNGTSDMIHATLDESPDLRPHRELFKDVVLVEGVGRFKPAPEVYTHLLSTVHKTHHEQDVWLISGNPFDVVGANAVGLRTCWVDRSGAGWTDKLVEGDKGRPNIIVSGLHEVVGKVAGYGAGSG